MAIIIPEQYTICKGCKDATSIIGHSLRACDIESPVHDEAQCPCSVCLVKVMCGWGCDEYTNFKTEDKQIWRSHAESYTQLIVSKQNRKIARRRIR